jgi:hypothetical protein
MRSVESGSLVGRQPAATNTTLLALKDAPDSAM